MMKIVFHLSFLLFFSSAQREPINGKCASLEYPLLVTPNQIKINTQDISSLLVGKCISESECELYNIDSNNINSGGRWSCLYNASCIPHSMPCQNDCVSEARSLVENCNECLLPGMPCGSSCSWSDITPFGKIHPDTKTLNCVPYCNRTEEWQCEGNCISKEEPCSASCPSDHWYCATDQICIPLKYVCDGKGLFGCSDGSDEKNCGTCASGMEKCGKEIRCMDWTTPCNGECPIGSEKCSNNKCVTHKESCEGSCFNQNMIPCGHKCYGAKEKCNGIVDCEDGSDEEKCGNCSYGSRKCGSDYICSTETCSYDVDEFPDSLTAKGPEDCFCSEYWCESERKCMSRDNKDLQSCEALFDSFPSIGPTIFKNVSGALCDSGLWDGSIFKQGSCVLDKDNQCPSSFLLNPNKIRFWVKCRDTCWSTEISLAGNSSQKYSKTECFTENFDGLCNGKCKYYDAWVCDSLIVCTDTPCHGECPTHTRVPYYYCNGTCIPETITCEDKCSNGLFKCEDKCLYPHEVCDGRVDCADGLDESKQLCNGCKVGHGQCNGQPLCLDSKCNNECMTLKDGTPLIDCNYESERNICSIRARTCDFWMRQRYGNINPV